ncbi:hypothetical protein [Lysinibacillus capsici]|uniref:hypothetical protein n=1 Tax=Lysinibacillus capsici TaxID=2115968 RepID=UPI002DBD4D93|nr:hypothetical protein [Lysinibacillus capsici]MEC1305558.1 hypothetical protein [Lysinibacillus capsici]
MELFRKVCDPLPKKFLKIKIIIKKEGIAESRNFCSLYGIDVEAATGISNGAFTCYFLNINVFNQEYIFRKATFILNMPFSI